MTATPQRALQRLAQWHRALAVTTLVSYVLLPLLMVFGTNLAELLGVRMPKLLAFVFLAAAPYALLHLLAADSLEKTLNRRFILIEAALSLLFFPFGTLLGAYTLAVLRRPDVRLLFDNGRATIERAATGSD